jgi:hypothetical protein
VQIVDLPKRGRRRCGNHDAARDRVVGGLKCGNDKEEGDKPGETDEDFFDHWDVLRIRGRCGGWMMETRSRVHMYDEPPLFIPTIFF